MSYFCEIFETGWCLQIILQCYTKLYSKNHKHVDVDNVVGGCLRKGTLRESDLESCMYDD